MPASAPRPCTYPGCGVLVQGGGRCDAHKRIEAKQLDQRRGTSHERGYTSAWQKARAAWLARHPLCKRCESAGQIVAATVVDHIIPHRGDKQRFWDSTNWQSLCKTCHDRKTATEDSTFARPYRGAGEGGSKV
ncbi:MAG: HNH endonuclease signature motif containing protein [bacterium]